MENLDTVIKTFPSFIAAVSFLWGVYQFVKNQKAQAETRRIEATKPFLERQLKLYTEATQAAATIATSKQAEEINIASTKFWSLYWGELALVEDKGVEAAMIEFGEAMKTGSVGQQQLQENSIAPAHACRDSLADSWGVKQWRNPHRPPT